MGKVIDSVASPLDGAGRAGTAGPRTTPEDFWPERFVGGTSFRKAALPLVQYVFQARFQTSYTVAFASCLMAMAPLLVVHVVAQRWVISGVTRGAVA